MIDEWRTCGSIGAVRRVLLDTMMAVSWDECKHKFNDDHTSKTFQDVCKARNAVPRAEFSEVQLIERTFKKERKKL